MKKYPRLNILHKKHIAGANRQLSAGRFSGLLLLLAIVFFQSCELVNPTSEAPSYLRIEKVNLTTDIVAHGEASHKITDVWTTVNYDFLGTFEIPTRIPILESGENELVINAGVKENGISNTRKIYPFYEPFITKATLLKENVSTLEPQFTYYKNTKFEYKEGFEGRKWILEPGSANEAIIDTANFEETHPVYGGEHCLKAELKSGKSYLSILSPEIKTLKQGKAVWMEIDFKTDVILGVGLASLDFQETNPWLNLNISKDWNKVYVNFTDLVARYPLGTRFRLFLYAEKSSEAESEFIYIDNIKLLYFE